MLKDKGLAFKLVLFILGCAVSIFAAAFTYEYVTSRNAVLKSVEENAKNLTLSSVHRIESILRSVERVSLNMAALVEQQSFTAPELVSLVETMVFRNQEIYGITVSYEPYAFDPESLCFAPFACRTPDGRVQSFPPQYFAYPYFFWDWYQIPKELGRPMWTEPYYNEEAGNAVMSTFSTPFYRGRDTGKQFQGVTTADISLEWLADAVRRVKIYKTGYAFLISRNGVFVTHPEGDLIMRRSIFSIAEEKMDFHLREVGRAMVRGEQGFVSLRDFVSGKKSWLYYAPLPSSGWAIGVIFPEDELFAEVNRLGRRVIAIGVLGFFALSLVIVLIAQTITRPLRTLADTTVAIAHGNLEIELPEPLSRDEIGTLARSFRDMHSALKEYIHNLAATTAAKERMESELKIAGAIQMSFLPKRFPPLADRNSLEISARIESAREIGGDLYDYFFMDPSHLFVVVGDVSGKGIPAALFMAVTKTLIKGMAEPGMEPSVVLEKVNRELCSENDSMMFVTLFCGVLNLNTGEFRYCNAGHVPPILLPSGGTPHWLDIPAGFVLGIEEGSSYTTSTVNLNPGDGIFLYTDGVTEATSASDTFFSDERLLDLVRSHREASAQELVQTVFDAVTDFCAEEPLFDDVTVLVVRYRGAKHHRH
ncbi:MAG: SpoIIE family protein phosphatase [Syntrophobacteraceae bacterium]|nr:SpoIIE family protein phosphatase [Syntrophobacteraceae bacterium]